MKTDTKMPKLAIRQYDFENLIRAYIMSLDEEKRAEVATLSLQMARDVPGLFERWKEMLADALRHLLTESGLDVVGMHETKLREKQ